LKSIAPSGIAAEYSQFVDGLRQLTILNFVLESNRRRNWIDIPALKTDV
jgi:hypothetical protein